MFIYSSIHLMILTVYRMEIGEGNNNIYKTISYSLLYSVIIRSPYMHACLLCDRRRQLLK